jgi:hypothetical protein
MKHLRVKTLSNLRCDFKPALRLQTCAATSNLRCDFKPALRLQTAQRIQTALRLQNA